MYINVFIYHKYIYVFLFLLIIITYPLTMLQYVAMTLNGKMLNMILAM